MAFKIPLSNTMVCSCTGSCVYSQNFSSISPAPTNYVGPMRRHRCRFKSRGLNQSILPNHFQACSEKPIISTIALLNIENIALAKQVRVQYPHYDLGTKASPARSHASVVDPIKLHHPGNYGRDLDSSSSNCDVSSVSYTSVYSYDSDVYSSTSHSSSWLHSYSGESDDILTCRTGRCYSEDDYSIIEGRRSSDASAHDSVTSAEVEYISDGSFDGDNKLIHSGPGESSMDKSDHPIRSRGRQIQRSPALIRDHPSTICLSRRTSESHSESSSPRGTDGTRHPIPPCCLCDSDGHLPKDCSADIPDLEAIILQKGLCKVCLLPGHLGFLCPIWELRKQLPMNDSWLCFDENCGSEPHCKKVCLSKDLNS